jgi:2-oxoisovalerate dehydrogenase E1 component
VNLETRQHLHTAYLVRTVEEQLLQLFAAGKLSGTTHTCIGQEMAAVALAGALDRRTDVVVSNHRCHGHYLAWTDDPDGLVAEVMGKATGICGGLGGSQHLSAPGFFSNGIQGGIVPVAAGLAFARKLAANGGIAAVCIGDGTLGEGVVYETLNIAAKWNLPLLIVLENNLYAQSTSQSETLAGDICARAAAFGIATLHGDTWRHEGLMSLLRSAAATVRRDGCPVFVRVDTYRLAAHSKSDDDRDPEEIARYKSRDPLNQFLANEDAADAPELASIRERVACAIERAAQASVLDLAPGSNCAGRVAALSWRQPSQGAGTTQLAAINRALGDWLAEDPRALVLGEDVRSPYGGAFKATRGLSDDYPGRVLNTPISEAGIVGIANGLALGGRRPIVEIMFGDFLALCFDQLLNHAAKFHGMYNGRVSSAIVVRTPMGGGRGYGPTHSQNLEKHLVGVPGLRVLVLHGRAQIAVLYRALRSSVEPTLIVENKLLYRERADGALPPGYELMETAEPYPTTVLRPKGDADVTIVAFGRMSLLAEQVAAELVAEEIGVELLFPLSVSPFDARPLQESVARTGKLVVVEEGAAHFDLASEVVARAVEGYRGTGCLRVRRIAAQPRPIPSALALELAVLPSTASLRAACLELYDE